MLNADPEEPFTGHDTSVAGDHNFTECNVLAGFSQRTATSKLESVASPALITGLVRPGNAASRLEI